MKYLVWQLLIFCFIQNVFCSSKLPLVLTTWKFTNATVKAWEIINTPDKTNVDAVVEGCSVCEREQCGTTVGYGGSPDEHGETTLDAMIMDGETMNVGAVAGLRRVKDVISVARHVLEHTKHTLLAGDLATEFARMMGFKEESLVTPKSKNMWKQWRNDNCQPNFWTNVVPDPNKQCGPYKPMQLGSENLGDHNFGSRNHDTIGMIVMNENGSVVAGTSTNGAKYKIPGRVGDSPIAGAGAYADNEAGAAVATGDGDVMMRFLPSFLAVEGLKSGLNTSDAAKRSIQRIRKHYPNFRGAVIVANINGEFSASCSGMDVFPFTYYQKGMENFGTKTIACIN